MPPVIFLATTIFVIFFTMLAVIKPRFEKNYKHEESSLIYFEHIARMTKDEFLNCWNKLDESQNSLELHYAEQIHVVSKILKKKLERTDLAIVVFCVSLCSFFIFLIIDSIK